MAVQIKEAARLLDVSESTVRNLIKSGKLRSVKLGGTKASHLVIYESIKQMLNI